MGELLGISIPVDLKWNGLAYQNSICVLSSYEDRGYWRICNCSLQHKLDAKASKTVPALCKLGVVPTSIKGHSFSGGEQLKQSTSNFGSSRTTSLLAVSDMVSSNQSFLATEENEDREVIKNQTDELDMDSVGKYLPPWGSLTVHQELDMDPVGIIHPSMSRGNKVSLKASRVHFLEEENVEELSKRILMLSRSNKVRSAAELFRSMQFSGLQPNSHACNSLISCLLRNNLLDHAMEVFEFMKGNRISTGHTYALILKGVADMQGCQSSLKMFAELGGFCKEENDFDVIVYNTMISVCGRVNNWVDTEKIWRRMKEKGCHGTEITYSLLVSIFVRCGRNELALDTYNEMNQIGITPRDDTLQACIAAFTKEGKWDLALNVFQNMLTSGLKPNLVACNALLNSLGKAGEYKLAFKVVKKVKSLGHTPDAYTWNALLNGLYRANQLADVLQLFENIKREQNFHINEHLYNTALMSCQKLGLWDKAIQLLWQLEACGLPVSATSYNLVIGACETARKPKVALQVYEHMIHLKCTPDTFTYLSLLRSCIWASMWGEVEEILEQVAPDVSLYNAVIHGMCLKGKFQSAKKLYMKMRRSGFKPDGKTRAMMLQNLKRGSTRTGRRPSHLRCK